MGGLSIRARMLNVALPFVFKRWFPPDAPEARTRARLASAVNGGLVCRVRNGANRAARALSRVTSRGVGVVRMSGAPVATFRITPRGGDHGGPTLFYVHGGGYVAGGIDMHRDGVARMALALGGTALLPDYRLAPEHPFPAAFDDALAAWRWAVRSGSLDPARTIVAGESAGGGLALAMLSAARMEGLPMPVGVAVFSPWTDLACTGESLRVNAAADPFLPAHMIPHQAAQYLGDADPRDARASPLHANVEGLPRTIIFASASEALRDDATRMAARMTAAGVDVTLELWPAMPHAWQMFAGFLPEGREAIARFRDWTMEETR